MSNLRLCLLGSFNVEKDGQPITGFATDKVRALLAYLAVEYARPHRRESLAGLLWPDQSEDRARQSLRQALSHLRQALGGDDFLLINPQEIQLHSQENIWCDVTEVVNLSRYCDNHPHRRLDHCLPCINRLTEIEKLYQGDFLEGFPSQNSDLFEEWLYLHREQLRQRALMAQIILADYAESCGKYSESLYHINEQIKIEPWREEAHRQAMRIYAIMGERSKALSQYRSCQKVLQTELSTVPTSETTILYEAIESGCFAATPKVRPFHSPVSSFIGRKKEISDVIERLSQPDCRLLTILGMGGIGKSCFASHIGQRLNGLYRDGIYFVSLVDEINIEAAISNALGYSMLDTSTQLSVQLRDKSMLLILDNFDHLVDQSTRLSDILSAATGVQIIVTSRERLRLREEWVYFLEGLSYPLLDAPFDCDAYDSIILFNKRATQIDPDFIITPDCLADISMICRLVEGNPLAIELAASSIIERPCKDIIASLCETFDDLVPTLRNFPARHHSLRVVFQHSWDLLTPGERTWLVRLSVFASGFTADSALDVAGITYSQLSRLVAKSLVRVDNNHRYSMHESIRQFSAEQLTDLSAIQQSHSRYFSRWVKTVISSDPSKIIELLKIERGNLRIAWNWSLENDPQMADLLLSGLSLLYTLSGPLTEGESLFAESLQSLKFHIEQINNSTSDQKILLTDFNFLVGKLSLELARIYNAQSRHDQAIEIAQSISHPPSLHAKALLVWGQSLSAQGKCEKACSILNNSLGMVKEIKDLQIEADCLRELGNVANRLTNYDEAMDFYQQSLALAKDMGDLRGESATLNNLATVEWDLGNLDAAKSHYEEALSLYRLLGNRLGEAKALNNLSNVLADCGNYQASLSFSEKALQIHREMNNVRGQSSVLNNLGATFYCLKSYDKARGSYQQALRLFRDSGNRQAEAETLANLSLLECVQGNLISAREYAHKAITLSEQVGDQVNLANVFYYLGRIEIESGKLEEAEKALRHALSLRKKVPHPGRIIEIKTELAYIALKQGNYRLAYDQVLSLLPTINTPGILNGTDDPDRIRNLIGIIQNESEKPVIS